MTEERILPVHPGETLSEEFLKPMRISECQLAMATNISEILIHQIIRGKKPVTAETALRLGRYFGMSSRFWIGLQGHYDLAVAEDKLQERIEEEIQPYAA